MVSFVLSLFLFLCLVFSQEKVWVDVEGEAYMGDLDTPKEVKTRAYNDARKKAIEQAQGVFIRANTIVQNNQLIEDLTKAYVRGKVVDFTILEEGWDSKDRNLYRVKAKVLVERQVPKTKHIKPKLSLSKHELKNGETFSIHFSTEEDAYVYIFSIAYDGSVVLLFPNAFMRDNFVKRGVAYKLPPEGANWKLKAVFPQGIKEPFVVEYIKMIATTRKVELLTLGFKQGMFEVYDPASTGMMGDLIRKLNQLEPDEWTDMKVHYRLSR